MTFTFQSATLKFDQESLDLTPNKTSSSEALYVDFTSTDDAGQKRFQIFIHPKKEVTLKSFELRLSVPLTANAAVFCNGFLSHHQTGTYSLSDKIPSSGWLTSKAAFHQQAPEFSSKNPFHSWHHGYVETKEQGLFLGSLNETTAFTSIEYDAANGLIIIRKDIENLQLGHSFPLLDLIASVGKKAKTLAAYSAALETKPLPAPPLSGCNGNSAAAINDFLALRKEENIPADFVLIGSGYATADGDWLYSNDQFPNGLPPLISEIKSAGLKVGMSISPLLCAPESDVYKQHSDWILKDEKNNSVTIKTESGTRYVLDAYDPGVQDYLQVFCYTVTTQWGIDLLKFDHLSTAFAIPRKTKTRAQASNDFLKMLRDSSPNCLIWATDLPIATGRLYANYTSTGSSRIGSWDTPFPLLYADKNADTAKVQLKNIIHRSSYSQYGTAGNSITLLANKNFTETQAYTILFINTLFSNIGVITDTPKSLSPEIWSEWRLADQWKSAEISKVRFPKKDACIIDFKNKDGKRFRGLVNLGNKETSLDGIKLGVGETLVLGNKN